MGALHAFAQRLAEADQSLVPVARYVAPDAKFMTSTPVASRSALTMPPSWHSADPLIQSLLDSNRSTSCCHRKEDCFTARGSSAENVAGRRLVEAPDDLRRVVSDFFDLLDNRKRRHQREAKANGSLWLYLNSGEAIYRCPADRSTVHGQPRVPRRRSVSMSSYMNPDSGPQSCYYSRAWHKLDEIRNPSPEGALVFVDEHQDSINDGYFMIGHTNHPGGHVPWAWYDAPALRHGEACTVSHADGRAEVWRMVEPTTGKVATAGRPNLDRDLKRFYAAIPWRIPIGQ